MSEPSGLCLLGVGEIFDTVASDPAGHGFAHDLQIRQAPGPAEFSASFPALLDGIDPARTRVFVAVDENALNYKRLELYMAARMRGLRMAHIRHASAIVAPDAVLGDNVYLAAGTIVGKGVRIESDVMLLAGVRVDADVRIGMHGWIGPGASLGAKAELGSHCVVGADVRLRAGARIGRHCVLQSPGPWSADLPSGSFLAPGFAKPAHMIGAGYSFEKTR